MGFGGWILLDPQNPGILFLELTIQDENLLL